MNRNSKLVKGRAKHIKNYVAKSKKNTTQAVKDVADKLFISPETAWKDLAKDE